MEYVPYGGWKYCLRLTNGTVELIVTTDVGPRVIRFGYVGGKNEFVEYADQLGSTGETNYRTYGGHRLWVAPETPGWTNHPDNQQVAAELENNELRLTPSVEVGTGLQKEFRISFLPGPSAVRVEHRVTNRGTASVKLAPWALSVMAPGGKAIIPHEPFIPHPTKVLPSRPLVLWHYTDMTDPRWSWGRRFIILRQDVAAPNPQKFGALITEGWGAYLNADRMFLKRFPFDPSAQYPDFGANAEFFTNAKMLEVESLGPLRSLRADETAVHVEHWYLFRNIQFPATEAEQERLMTELLQHTQGPD